MAIDRWIQRGRYDKKEQGVIEVEGKTSKARRFLGMTEGAILIIGNGIKVFELNCRA
jgi:hypothetical protein